LPLPGKWPELESGFDFMAGIWRDHSHQPGFRSSMKMETFCQPSVSSELQRTRAHSRRASPTVLTCWPGPVLFAVTALKLPTTGGAVEKTSEQRTPLITIQPPGINPCFPFHLIRPRCPPPLNRPPGSDHSSRALRCYSRQVQLSSPTNPWGGHGRRLGFERLLLLLPSSAVVLWVVHALLPGPLLDGEITPRVAGGRRAASALREVVCARLRRPFPLGTYRPTRCSATPRRWARLAPSSTLGNSGLGGAPGVNQAANRSRTVIRRRPVIEPAKRGGHR